jgi:arylsulfatase A-like enzyme
MKKYIRVLMIFTGITSLFYTNTLAQRASGHYNQKKPRNIILVIADDVGAEQIRSYAMELQYSSEFDPAKLPNIHLLEKAGIRFTQAWANPSCSPTRAGIHTGQYSCTHGIYNPKDISERHDSLEPIPDPLVYVPLALSMEGSGYKKALFGKWHLGYGINTTGSVYDYDLPRQDGFDHYAGSYGGEIDGYMEWEKTTNGSTPVTMKNHATFDLVNDAKKWISARAINMNPFLAVLAFNAPHWTGTAQEWNYLDLSPHCIDVTKFSITSTDTTIYKAQLHCLDAALGELINFMKAKHPAVLDNTIIIFIGDNGTDNTVGEGPVATNGKAKGSLYQAGIHIPFIIADGHWLTDARYRNTTAATSVGFITIPGTTCDRLIHTRDIYGTVREFAGIPAPDLGTESHSVVKFMSNPSAPGEQYVISEGQDTCEYAIRNDHFKLIHNSTGVEEFYKIDRYKWDDEASGVTIDKDLMTSEELGAYKKLKAKLQSMPCYCEKK